MNTSVFVKKNFGARTVKIEITALQALVRMELHVLRFLAHLSAVVLMDFSGWYVKSLILVTQTLVKIRGYALDRILKKISPVSVKKDLKEYIVTP